MWCFASLAAIVLSVYPGVLRQLMLIAACGAESDLVELADAAREAGLKF